MVRARHIEHQRGRTTRPEIPLCAGTDRATHLHSAADVNNTPARIAQVVFLVAAVAAVMVFASVVQDAERRRSPDHLVELLNPSYVGDNRVAPDFDLVDRNGEHHHLRDYRGKTVVLHFWTRTCEPCVDELQRTIPTFDEIITARDDIALLMVTVDSNWEAISPLVPPGAVPAAPS